jgi:hypothetical protein
MTLGNVERTETTTAVQHAATALPLSLEQHRRHRPLTCCLRVPAWTNPRRPRTIYSHDIPTITTERWCWWITLDRDRVVVSGSSYLR